MKLFPTTLPWRIVLCTLLALGTSGARAAAAAEDDAGPDANHWRLVVSPYTHHYRYSAEHRKVWAVGLERQQSNRWLLGLSYFQNSFGQPSGYVYVGRRIEGLFGVEPWFAQWSTGVLYGYTGKYKTKVPLNFHGFAPGALLSSGWQVNRAFSAQLNLLGDAGVMLQLSYALR